MSDADIQSASDFETMRIGRRLLEDLSATLPSKRKKMLTRIRDHGRVNSLAVMPLLLRHYYHQSPKISVHIRQIIDELLQQPGGYEALKESLFSAHHTVSEVAADILEERGLEGRRLKEYFDAIRRNYSQLKSMEVHTRDVEELVSEAIGFYRDGATEEAFENIVLAHDLLRDRVDWNEGLRRYIKDVLRLTPDLSHGGVQIDNIQESLKALTEAVKSRDYRETKELVDERKMESSIRRELASAFSFISRRLKETEIEPKVKLPKEYEEIFDDMKKVTDEIFNALDKDNRLSGLKSLYTFTTHEFTGGFLKEISERIDEKDQSILKIAREATVGMTKILAIIMPNVAENLFDDYLKEITQKESIDDLPWPGKLKELGKRKQKGKKAGRKKKKGASRKK